MRLRRAILFACLAGIALGTGVGKGRAETTSEDTRGSAERPGAASDPSLRLSGFIRDLKPDALAAGVSAATFDAAVQGVGIDSSILELMSRQPEHVLAPWDYLGRLVSEQRIADGRSKLIERANLLADLESRIGVDRHVLVAIWGIETSYGMLPGTRPVIRSLSTLAVADQRRAAFWRKELIAALMIVEAGDITAARMVGSWAGAMGHTQFMPVSYTTHAVDFDGDGRRDIWGSIPDALASTGAYLIRSGWKRDEPWAREVVLPAGFDYRAASPSEPRSLADWQDLGILPPANGNWPAQLSPSTLLLPAGMHGPAFLAGPNFRAILKYNNSPSYALSVGLLADRLAGRPGLAAMWPTDDPPLDASGRRELQRWLLEQGHQIGAVDGVIGEATRGALRVWQDGQGLPVDGWAGARLLERVRQTGQATSD